MFKNASKFLLFCLVASVVLSLVAVEVSAQTYYITIEANVTEVASVEMVGSYSGTHTYNSFPATHDIGPFGVEAITVTVTTQTGYNFSYAISSSSSYLSNPFGDMFYSGDVITIYCETTVAPTPTPGPSATPAPGPSGYSYLFRGLYDEDNVNTYLGNVTVTAYYSGSNVGIGNKSVERFTVIGTYAYYPPSQPLYFSFDLSNYYGQNVTREYWLSSNEDTASIYIYAAPTGLSTVVFNIRALGGVSLTDKFLVARNIYSDTIIEKIPIDTYGNVAMQLKAYSLYKLTIEDGTSIFSFGDVAMTATPITLTVSPLSFPSEIILQYKYVHLYASRPTNSEIRIDYEDTKNETASVTYNIAYINGTVAYTNTLTSSSFVEIWSGANAETTYYISATVVHSEFGTMTFQQVLSGTTDAATPIDFAVFGSFGGIDTTQILGVLIVLIIFGVFSAFNAYIGIFAGVVTAAIMVWIGWLSSLSQAGIVAAFALTILLSITYWKRRIN